MKANISRREFYQRLKSNVLVGEPLIKGTPFVIVTIFDSRRKYFYGEYDESSFRLTKNSTFNPTEFILEGTYELADDNHSAEVDYRIKPIWFGYLWIRVVPLVFLAFVTFILLSIDDKNNVYIPLAIVWIFIGMVYLFLLARSKSNKINLEEIFRSKFVSTKVDC